jgi:hypothetical protein
MLPPVPRAGLGAARSCPEPGHSRNRRRSVFGCSHAELEAVTDVFFNLDRGIRR